MSFVPYFTKMHPKVPWHYPVLQDIVLSYNYGILEMHLFILFGQYHSSFFKGAHL